jgi:hypothetical protein
VSIVTAQKTAWNWECKNAHTPETYCHGELDKRAYPKVPGLSNVKNILEMTWFSETRNWKG